MLSLPPNLRCAVILSRIPKRYHPERSEGSAFALGIPKSAILPRRPPTISDPEPARIPRLQSAVILNAVKDLRLPSGLPSGVTSELPTIQPQCRVQDHHPLPQSSVILNAVKDLRLLLASQNPRYLRVGHQPSTIPNRHAFRDSKAL